MYSEHIAHDLRLADELFSKKNGPASIERVMKKVENGERPTLEEAGALLMVDEESQVKRLIKAADSVTRKHHGDKIGLIAPLYFSNVCWNDCSCCDMSSRNRHLERRTLNMDEFKREFGFLRDVVGYKTIEIVAGGFSLKSGTGKVFLQFIDYGRKNIKNFAFFVDTLEPEEYKEIADPKTTMIHWQESYFKGAYLKMVKHGPKTDFEKRLNAHDLFIQAGGRKVGLSVLAGVADDFLKDVFLLLCHAKYLEKKYGISPSCFGTVRIKQIERKGVEEFSGIPDRKMYLATALYRLMFPDSNIIATSRETQDVIRKQLEAGATFTNTTCTTVPGGYKDLSNDKHASIGQFHHESPPIELVERTIRSIGKIIDWDKEL